MSPTQKNSTLKVEHEFRIPGLILQCTGESMPDVRIAAAGVQIEVLHHSKSIFCSFWTPSSSTLRAW
eukprot:3434250-Pyramimonas_sp.AAC.1